MQDSNGEALGELTFTHYYIELAEQSGINFSGMRWNALTDWERNAWIGTARQLIEVATGQRALSRSG